MMYDIIGSNAQFPGCAKTDQIMNNSSGESSYFEDMISLFQFRLVVQYFYSVEVSRGFFPSAP